MIIGTDHASVDANKPPDFEAAKRAMPPGTSYGFAIVRAVYHTVPDQHFWRDWAPMKAAGLTRGAYLFLVYPSKSVLRPSQPTVQAKSFANVVGELEVGDLPPILDVEFPGGNTMGVDSAIQWTLEAWTTLRGIYRTPPLIYSSARVWAEDLAGRNVPQFSDSPAWLAKPWPWAIRTKAQLAPTALVEPTRTGHGVPAPWVDAKNWWIQQYQGDAIEFPGFTKTVDVNRFNVMRPGESGERVRWVQRRLGMTDVSGVYDDAMLAHVQSFQQLSGLVADGVIGPKTFARVCWMGGAEANR